MIFRLRLRSQVVDPKEVFAEFRVADKPLTKDQVIGEVASLLMGDYRIQRAGVFWDRDAFPGLEKGEAMFAPVAYRTPASRSYQVEDMARLKDYREQKLLKIILQLELFHLSFISYYFIEA
jgi:hypothetical protein